MDAIMDQLPNGLSFKTAEALHRLAGVFELQSDQVFQRFGEHLQNGLRWLSTRAVHLFRESGQGAVANQQATSET